MRRFLIDNQLPAALGRWLEAHGQKATHVLELGMAKSDDTEIWAYAALNDCVIITKDEDFSQLSLLRAEAVPVVWLRLGNCRTNALLAAWESAWPQIDQQLSAGDRLVEVW